MPGGLGEQQFVNDLVADGWTRKNVVSGDGRRGLQRLRTRHRGGTTCAVHTWPLTVHSWPLNGREWSDFGGPRPAFSPLAQQVPELNT